MARDWRDDRIAEQAKTIAEQAKTIADQQVLIADLLARVAKLSVERTTMAILPWLIPLLASLAFVTYVPSISLWLPNAMR